MRMDEKRFKIVKPGTNEDVFGGEVSGENVYVKIYGVRLDGQKPVEELEVGESSLHRYSLSGTAGTYSIVRVS